ncbi:MAG: hypothetical protein Q9170_006675 [Blastenia crenularia]
MGITWRLLLVINLFYGLNDAAPQPCPVVIDPNGVASGVYNGSETTTLLNMVPTVKISDPVQTRNPPTTSSMPTVTQTQSTSKESFALTPHSQESAPGFEPITLTPPNQRSAAGFGAISTVPGCFNRQTQLISNQYTTTALIPCLAGSPQESSRTWSEGGGPFSNIPHTEKTVTGSDTFSILNGGMPRGGRGGNPLPQPETTVHGGDMSSILGGPGHSSPKDSSEPAAPVGGSTKTAGEPGPITASPAATPPAPAPTQTSNSGPGQQPPPAGGSNPVQSASVPPLVTPSPVITIGSSTVTADSSSHFVIGSQTLAPGGPPITHSGTVLSLPSSGSGVIIGPSTQEVQTIQPTPPPSITVGGQVVTADSASQFRIGGQTLKPGAAAITANGRTLSLAASGSTIVINNQPKNIGHPSPTPLSVITVAGAKITGNSASQYVVGGQTLAAGRPPITVSGQVLSIASSGNAVVFGPSTQVLVTPPILVSTGLPVLTVGGSTITANSASDYVIAGQTVHAGGSAITVDGTIISLAPSATALVVGGSTEALTPSLILATTEPPLITLGSQVLNANAVSDYVIGGQWLTLGHAITVSGRVISLAPGAPDVVIGGSTEALTPQLVNLSTGLPVLTIGSTTVSANSDGEYVLSGQTIRPGAHAVTIGGQLLSLAANDSMLVVGTSTEILHAITKTGETLSRSLTRLSGPASSTAMASATAGSIPTLGGPALAAARTGKSGVRRLASSIWFVFCVITITMLAGQAERRPKEERRHRHVDIIIVRGQAPNYWTHQTLMDLAYQAPLWSTYLRNQMRAHDSSSSRPFATSPARRKDLPPDDIPDPIPVKKETQMESDEQQEQPPQVASSLEDAIEAKKTSETPSSGPTATSSTGSVEGSSGSGSGGESGAGDGGKKGGRKTSNERAIQKPSVPEIYPQVMAIPIAKRPLFPGFYKAVTIRDPNVALAIQEMMKRGQQYVGAFLFKDEASDKDVIENMDEVHDVGVFAQITSAFPVNGEAHSLTAVLYPHRRIKMSRLITPNERHNGGLPEKPRGPPIVEIKPADDSAAKDSATPEKPGDVVASFEESGTAPQSRSVQPYEPTAFLRGHAVSLVDVDNLVEKDYDRKDPVIKAVTSELVNVFKDVANLNHLFRDQISTFSMSQSAGNILEEPGKLADFAAAVSQGEIKELQDVLEEMNVQERLSKALMVLKKELMNAQLQAKISKDVESKIQKRQREYWLMEQMKGIRRELGIESDGKDKMVEKFREKASKLAMPEAVRKVFDEELNKLAHLEPAASEFNVARNYLDWLTQIPWGQQSAENFGIKNAMTVLDEDHHGLKDVKGRILEFIAVGKLRGTVEGKILCFVGPPGVGKTSIGKSIARALNRQYYRFSVGGLTDVAEIKGHRRTYVGALPGRIIQALKKCQTENPLILIDEVDKIGRGHQGDPSSALLELLDPEQNNSFLDHYMDVPVDLSKVLFVCTANMTDTIPRPLLDRMEMIELSGYVADEKMAIAERYLAPAAKELSGLKDVAVNLDKAAIEELIKSYCRESGVRNLKKQIEKVYRKSALNIIRDVGESEENNDALAESNALTEEGKKAQEESHKDNTDVKDTPASIAGETTPTPRVSLKVPSTVNITIDRSNLKDYVGPPVFTSDRLYETTPPGVAMGLAWTSMGGAALYVESILENALTSSSRPGLERTGNLKNVMRESTLIAYSFAKGLMAREFPRNKFFEKAKVHLHCPEGAVQKDGPSAGITMATSLLSLALGKGVGPTVAMTGELTVTGKVLRIGGLREKTVAARRAGAERIVFPRDNLSDWIELPENIKEGIQGHPASWYSEVFDLVFPDLDREATNDLWKEQLADDANGKSKDKEGEED